MKLSREVVYERYLRTEERMSGYRRAAEEWQKMYKGDAGLNITLSESLERNQEQVIPPIPFMTVNLSQRLLSAKPRIQVFPNHPTDSESNEYAEKCEKWLQAYWKRVNRDQGRSIAADIIWYALVRGRFAIEVKWVKKKLPKHLQSTMMPIQLRALDPMNIGYYRGAHHVEWVYHTYRAPLIEVMARWPEIDDADPGSILRTKLNQYHDPTNEDKSHEAIEVDVVDWWYYGEEDGKVYNCVLIDDYFGKEPEKTKYPMLPIVVGKGDSGANMGEEWEGLSILHPINGLWQFMARLSSYMATGVLWDFWPATIVEVPDGVPMDDITINPGETTPVPAGSKVYPFRLQANVDLAQNMYDQVNRMVQQATYPDLMFGQPTPGSQEMPGFGMSMLADAARGRTINFAEGLEMGFSHTNSLILAMIEAMGGEDGVDINLWDEQNDQKVRLNLNKGMIKGSYENEVRIRPTVPGDEAAKINLGIQLVQAKMISMQTFRDRFLDIEVPSDEDKRITLEELMQSDELRAFRLRRIAEESFDRTGTVDVALRVLYGTPFMPRTPEGFEWYQAVQDGPVTLREMQSNQPPPPGGGEMPMEDPMAPPPGPDMGGPSPLQPPGIPGLPPEMAGQMVPEDMGMMRDADPALFQGAMGNQPPVPPPGGF